MHGFHKMDARLRQQAGLVRLPSLIVPAVFVVQGAGRELEQLGGCAAMKTPLHVVVQLQGILHTALSQCNMTQILRQIWDLYPRINACSSVLDLQMQALLVDFMACKFVS